MRDALSLARKLRPLMPKDVERWLTARSMGDPETARLVDEQIQATAKKVFGDMGKHVLLSLPPQDVIDGPVHLGTVVYGEDRWSAGLRLDEVLQSVSIFGRSGSGKTNATIQILRQLNEQGVPFLMFDSKRTLRHALSLFNRPVGVYTPGRALLPFSFNVFKPPVSMDPIAYAGQLVDVITEAYTLGDGARRILQKVLVPLYENGSVPDLKNVLAAVEALPVVGRQGGWKVSALRALESMEFAGVGGQSIPNVPNPLESLSSESIVLEVDSLSLNARKLLVPLVCLHLFKTQLATRRRESLSLVVVFEEAHQYLRGPGRTSRETLVETLMRQWRELGIGSIIVDQHVSRISPVALGNAFATLVFNLKDPLDVSKAASLASVEDEEKRCFTRLPVGHAVVKMQDRYRSAFLVKVPLMSIDKGAVTDEVLAAAEGHSDRLDQNRGANSARSGGETGNSGRKGDIRAGDEALSEDDRAFIEDVIARPDDGVGKRYRRLQWSGERGHRVRSRLVRDGWLESQVVPVRTTRLLLLRPTAKARQTLRLPAVIVPAHESIEHAYWKRRYAAKYRAMGYRVQLEATHKYGRVDVLATKGEDSIAIEIETGKGGQVIENVRNCLRAVASGVVVVATTPTLKYSLTRQIGGAGLLIAGNVRVEHTSITEAGVHTRHAFDHA